MAPILNVSRYDPRRIRRASAVLTGAVVALALLGLLQLAAAAYLVRQSAGDRSPAAELTRELERREARLAELRDRLTGEERRSLVARITFLNRLLEVSAFSWTGLLYELERAIPPEVSLAEIQPDSGTGKVRLHGVATTPEGLAAFARRLEARPAFEEVLLLRQAATSDAARGEPSGVEFQVLLVYRGAR